MTESNWNNVQSLYERALELPPEEREQFVRDECPNAPAVLRDVLELLAHTSGTSDFLKPVDLVDDMEAIELAKPDIPDHRLIRPFDHGGMGAIVWLAEDLNLGRMVAVKVLDATLVPRKTLQRFQREARLVAKIDHPGIVKIHHQGVHEGRHYFSMELVEGRDLAQELRSHRDDRKPNTPSPLIESRGGKPAIRESVRICRDAALVHGSDIHASAPTNAISFRARRRWSWAFPVLSSD